VTVFDTPELHALLRDMDETMIAADGAGLAAPQIGVNLQVVLFGSGPSTHEAQVNPRYPDAPAIPRTVLINPVLTPLDELKEEGWEGCLSVPGLRGRVPRYARLRYAGFDQFGQPFSREVAGFHARVVQHEVDHLHGVLYPMRMTDLRKLGYTSVLFPGLADGED
jgi:peptide deformylase